MTLGRATGEWHVQESSVQGPGGRSPAATAAAAAVATAPAAMPQIPEEGDDPFKGPLAA